MPGKHEVKAYRLHAKHYLEVLHHVNDLYVRGHANVSLALEQLDAEWLNIQEGQIRAASYAKEGDDWAVMCIAYPQSATSVLELRLAPSTYTRWLESALDSIQEVKTHLRKTHVPSQNDALLCEWISYLQDIISHESQNSSQDQEAQRVERAAVVWNSMNIERICRARQGWEYQRQGDYKQARKYQLQALSPSGYIKWWEWPIMILKDMLGRKQTDPVTAAVLAQFGDFYRDQGRYRLALGRYLKALKAAHATSDRQLEAGALNGLGLVHKHLGQYEQAINYFQQVLIISRERGDRHREEQQLGNLGEAYRLLEQYDFAIEYLQQALAVARELGDRRDEGVNLGNLGTTYSHSGQYKQAIDCYQQALVIAGDIGDERGKGDRTGNLGDVYMLEGDYKQAREYHQQALKIARGIRNRRTEANTLFSMGYISLQQGQFKLGLEYLQQARDLFVSMGVKHKVRDIDRLMPYAQLGMQSLPCEVCSRRIIRYGAGEGYVLVSAQEQIIGIGTAEECWECGRLYCDHCYPSRPPNACACGKGREKDRVVGKVHFRGSLHLIKVRYLSAPYLE